MTVPAILSGLTPAATPNLAGVQSALSDQWGGFDFLRLLNQKKAIAAAGYSEVGIAGQHVDGSGYILGNWGVSNASELANYLLSNNAVDAAGNRLTLAQINAGISGTGVKAYLPSEIALGMPKGIAAQPGLGVGGYVTKASVNNGSILGNIGGFLSDGWVQAAVAAASIATGYVAISENGGLSGLYDKVVGTFSDPVTVTAQAAESSAIHATVNGTASTAVTSLGVDAATAADAMVAEYAAGTGITQSTGLGSMLAETVPTLGTGMAASLGNVATGAAAGTLAAGFVAPAAVVSTTVEAASGTTLRDVLSTVSSTASTAASVAGLVRAAGGSASLPAIDLTGSPSISTGAAAMPDTTASASPVIDTGSSATPFLWVAAAFGLLMYLGAMK